MITIRHATLAADRPEDGIDADQWDEGHTVEGLAPVAVSGAYGDLGGIPATFPPSAHGHVIAEVADLQAALDAKAPLASPAFSGAPSAPTAAPGTNSTQLATTAFVQALITALIGTSPAVLDTLGEIATALGNDPNFAGTVVTQLAAKQPIDPTLTALAGLAGGANQLAYFTGTDVVAQTPLTPFGRTVIGLNDYAALRAGLNVADGATANLGDVVGPAGAENDALAGFDGLTGKALKSGLITLTEAVAMRDEIAAARGDRASLARRIDDINDFASPNVGAVVPGRYYDQSLQAANSTTVAGSANRIEMSPFLTSQRMRIDQIGVSVSTLIAGSLLRCFIYSSGEDGWPEDLIFEGGSDLSGAAAVYVAHSLDYTFDKGRKFWVGVRFSANTTVRATPNSAMGNLGIQTSAATAYNTQLRDTLAFATPLPAVWTFAEAQLAAGNPPSIRMRAIAL